MKTSSPTHFERMLEIIEDWLWLLRLEYRIYNRTAELARTPKSTDLRQSLERHDYNACLAIAEAIEKDDRYQTLASHMAATAMDLINWYFASKRIYSLSGTLSELLLETKLPEFRPEDMQFVAHSFAVRLHQPIVSPSGMSYDMVVCVHESDTNDLLIHAFASGLPSYKRMSILDRSKLEKALRKGDSRYPQLHGKLIDEINNAHGLFGIRLEAAGSNSYQEAAEKMLQQHAELRSEHYLHETILRIVLGTNLYVQTKRDQQDTENRITDVPKRSERGRSVMHGVGTFELTTSYVGHRKPSSDDTSESASEVRPHFRQGYWRRPKGYGQDPTAIATEWVRPTWVRMDKIVDGETPLGANRPTI